MPVRFNPPPGWQVPPGFRPDSTWAPDPSWPPAPPGWNYWVERPDSPQPGTEHRHSAPPTPPAPPEPATGPDPDSPADTRSDAGTDTRTVAIQVVDTPGGRPAAGAPGPADLSPLETMGSTMTMAPISTPASPPRPGSGPQPVYPPQPGAAPPPPPPEAPAKGAGAGVLAALKGLGSRGANPSSGPTPSAGQQSGPGRLGIEDTGHSGPGGPSSARPRTVAPTSGGSRQGAGGRQSRSRPPGAGLMIAIAVAGLALGVIVGVVVTAGQQADANQAITDAQNIQAQLDEKNADIEAQRTQIKKQRDEVAEREQALGEREAQLKEREKALEQQEQQQQEQQQQEEQQQNNDNGPGNGNGDNPGTVFYWNCDAVRAAGAAPLSDGQPGYLPHLDRNGNGVACEDGE